MKLSIVIPCYNEAKNIPLILEKFKSVINRDDIEVIMVNNGSTDNSHEILDELIFQYPFARVINVAVNQGYGFGIVSGLKEAKGEFIGYTHADMQTDPSDPIKALSIIEKQSNPHNCYVKGDRKGRSLFDQFFTIGMSAFETFLFGLKALGYQRSA
ncbi:glycosyltransferase family 2 protein [Sulfurospirillum diekertiae]|uniref:Poly-beta-1,6-N-acetyl-D-glucosamine synthase n=1 Tax=Sulfurospirillum diekertiae TaxID=1854492 RepID=A0A1Y0HN32_9BACT|nr:glycosyltransferase family 2 protein [Sulfurospirillum diekertiae]ARU49512.1 Poly-beta-1,6-N-acetyl-D-glucosamine synthase [Sulfurospirillum diekertiae]ASC94316.1 Poly-beta-1,6-N-acetyl-D-glucosamine synthase [Sulfurospirillum diekertiae]